MARTYKMYLGGEWVDRADKIAVANPFNDEIVGAAASASAEDYTQAIEIAHRTFAVTRDLPAYKRSETCLAVANGLEKNIEQFTKMMCRELGKAYRDSRAEVKRAIGVFTVAAEEARRIGGEIIDLDWAAGSEERVGLVRRFPRGVVAGIAPFNFPLNLVAHKIAPAIAAGNTIVLKPASKTPLIALMLAALIDKTDHPKGAVSILPGSSAAAAPLLEDRRVRLITFTGSSAVGWWIKKHAAEKEVVLELGGNAGVAVADDADLAYAVERLAYGAFAVAGQSCISVQRIFVHEDVYDEFVRRLKARVKRITVGDPLDPNVDMGMMVDRASVQATLDTLRRAVAQGAKVIAGGKALCDGRTLEPTLLENVKADMDVCSKEAFAPLAVLMKYRDFHRVVDAINDSDYGLQAGIFTQRIKDIWYAFERIEAGGVVVNDIPTYRADHQPYGGMKSSGVGREGVRYAIQDQTEVKILSLNLK
ncbi:MAG TPA: aldehyde dehydrogenase family protein [candidate division Zixibacteria bacterium]|nr:aldehyde dehydrogenase family protein [candidate division Zixibacteria bacterium]MDD4918248.1 aldehyde dehydrogenase family protein [candidate division Zixibacteria bacterium]MDM7973989.1 aldehyde dehydrogenase family protein [candidate division Zixibacteria bacterium]HOD66520.1 aldehyde dehydrogenase family protein [candidate division Zixibacteria bacterium]HOZ06655.1 aldehyde dehydrogenase family protein [candidate division Zixibacteria bacterium]